jgi:tetratricopeptide (TPR) repeat protein
MATEPGWLTKVRRAWDEAVVEPARVDGAVEILFGAVLQEARGRRDQREGLLVTQLRGPRVSGQPLRDILPLVTEAVVAWATGEFRQAELAFARLAPASRRTRKEQSPLLRCVSAHALAWQAACATRNEALERAGKLLDKAESLVAEESWPNCRGWLHAERGRLAFWNDEITTACRHYAQAEESFRQTQNRFGLANIAEGLARIEIHQGRYAQALQQLLRAERSREPDDHLGQIKRLYHSGRIHRYQGKLDEAASDLERSLELLIEHVNNQRWEAHVRDVLGDVYLLRGEVHLARKQFSAPVFDAADPLFRLRRRYRAAKLAIAEAESVRHPTERRHALEHILKTCDELIRESTRQQLAEKSLRLKGTAYELLGDPLSAAKTLETAAAQFAEHRAKWYVSDCLHQAGCLQVVSGNVEQAAIDFIGALHSAVDDRQRRRVLDSLSSRFQKLDAQVVCRLLADLLQQMNEA